MKYVINILAIVFLGWPALVAGYAWHSLTSGFSVGLFLARRHEEAVLDKFSPDAKKGAAR